MTRHSVTPLDSHSPLPTQFLDAHHCPQVRCRSTCLPRCARCDVTGTAQLDARAVVQWCLPHLRLPTSSCAVPGRRALTSRPGTQPRCGPGCNPRRLRRRRVRFPRELSVLKHGTQTWYSVSPSVSPSGRCQSVSHRSFISGATHCLRHAAVQGYAGVRSHGSGLAALAKQGSTSSPRKLLHPSVSLHFLAGS